MGKHHPHDDKFTFDFIKSCLSYDENTGFFTWMPRPRDHFKSGRAWKMWNTRYAGERAGSINDKGYVVISLCGIEILAHRIAWLLTTGNWPKVHMDHLNGETSDNSIANIRCVTRIENMMNKSRYSNNSSGVTGVYWIKSMDRWKANITVNGKNTHLGYFREILDAVAARKTAEADNGFHENHGRSK